jgi:hypothetical protein
LIEPHRPIASANSAFASAAVGTRAHARIDRILRDHTSTTAPIQISRISGIRTLVRSIIARCIG